MGFDSLLFARIAKKKSPDVSLWENDYFCMKVEFENVSAMKKVLVIGPNFFYFNDSIAAAYRDMGWQVEVLAYDSPVHPYDWKNKLRYKLSFDKEALKGKGRRLFSDCVRDVYTDFMPDFVFVVNGEALLPDVTEMMREKSKVVVWLFDSVRKYPMMKGNLRLADAVFCYEHSDIETLKRELDVDASFLPQAADLRRYYKMEGQEKLYDVVFAGDIWQSSKRQRILQKVVCRFPDRKILVWGVCTPWYKNVLKWMFRKHRDIYMNRNASAETLNLCYNQAKVVLNIHNEQQLDGANPKVYEISATGACQVCDANPYIESLFPNGELYLYHSDEECLNMIEKALEAYDGKKGEPAYKEVVSKHSFQSRMLKVLETLNL